jgi:hypothetical protein
MVHRIQEIQTLSLKWKFTETRFCKYLKKLGCVSDFRGFCHETDGRKINHLAF